MGVKGQFVWVGSDAWSSREVVVQHREPFVEGAIAIQPLRRELPNYNSYFRNLTMEPATNIRYLLLGAEKIATLKILTKAGLCSQKPLVHRVFGGISQMFKCWKSILSNQGRSEAQSTALHSFRPGRRLRFCPCLTSASPGNNHFAIIIRAYLGFATYDE